MGFSHEPVLFLPHKPSDSSHSQPSLPPRISTILHTIAIYPVDTGEKEKQSRLGPSSLKFSLSMITRMHVHGKVSRSSLPSCTLPTRECIFGARKSELAYYIQSIVAKCRDRLQRQKHRTAMHSLTNTYPYPKWKQHHPPTNQT